MLRLLPSLPAVAAEWYLRRTGFHGQGFDGTLLQVSTVVATINLAPPTVGTPPYILRSYGRLPGTCHPAAVPLLR